MSKPRRMNLSAGPVEAINIREDRCDIRVTGYSSGGQEIIITFKDLCPWVVDTLAKAAWQVVNRQQEIFDQNARWFRQTQQRQKKMLRTGREDSE